MEERFSFFNRSSRMVAVAAMVTLGASALAVADEAERNPSGYMESRVEDSSQHRGSKNESWYTYWGLGWSRPDYHHQGISDSLSSLKSIPGVSNVGLNLDLLGFYFPVNYHQTAIGFIWNYVGDRYSKDGASIQFNQHLLSFSTMHFLTRNIGDGFFVRGDLGLSRYVVNYDFNRRSETETSSFGWGALAGLGYAIPLTPGTRWLIGANYAYRNANSGDDNNDESIGVSTVSLTTGLMF
jgi:hypothetical protein